MTTTRLTFLEEPPVDKLELSAHRAHKDDGQSLLDPG